jgi:hypothetical protein
MQGALKKLHNKLKTCGFNVIFIKLKMQSFVYIFLLFKRFYNLRGRKK